MECPKMSIAGLVVASAICLITLPAISFAEPAEPVPAFGVELNVRSQTGGQTLGEVPINMVLIEGGSFRMGISEKDVMEAATGDWERQIESLIAMVPAHEVWVDDFLIDQYEVTNLQFKTYLEATGLTESEDLIDLSWHEWQAGQKVPGMPESQQHHPIRGVSHIEASRCASWIGKRLPTEAEWEYVARRHLNSDQYYPWDAEGKRWEAWDKAQCSNGYNSAQDAGIMPWKVGHWKGDQTKDGVFDLCGNVCEWTSSRFAPYPGHQPLEVKIRKKKKTIRGAFNSEHYAIRGGSCYGNEISNNLVVRWGDHPRNVFEAVGFRTAMSATPGLDQLRHALQRDLTLMGGSFKDVLEFSKEAIGAQHTQYIDPDNHITRGAAYLAFTRIEKAPGSKSRMIKDSVEEAIPVGIFTTSSQIAQPSLPPGSYGVFFKAKGKSEAYKEALKKAEEEEKRKAKEKKKGDEEEEDKEKEPELTPEQKDEQAELQREMEKIGMVQTRKLPIIDIPIDIDVFLIKNEAADVVAWVPAELEDDSFSPTIFRYEAGAGSAAGDGVSAGNATLNAAGPNDLATFEFSIRAGSSSRHPRMTLQLEFPAGAFEPLN